jgi:hypothetical protein
MSTCATCRFNIDKTCHRYPWPSAMGIRVVHFPMIVPGDWCGEWKGVPPCICIERCTCKEKKALFDEHVRRMK